MIRSNEVESFLKKHTMHPDAIQLSEETDKFIHEMQAGLTDQPESLKMLCTYIQDDQAFKVDEPVIAIDAGGTNLRISLIRFDPNKQPKIEYLKAHPMLGTQGEISKEKFFAQLVDYLQPVINMSHKIGFCLSFPVVIQPDLDGLLLGLNKEVRVREMHNVLVGAELKRALKNAGIQDDKSVVMLNDTVATLLGGKSAAGNRLFSSNIGLILGTGTNTCYVEKNANLIKVHEGLVRDGHTIVNIESGGYARLPRGIFDIRYDLTTQDPGSQCLEKMVSGVYIGHVLLHLLHQAAADGLFTVETGKALQTLYLLSAKDVDEFCLYPTSGETVLGQCIHHSQTGDNQADLFTLFCLIDALFERAAKIIAVNLAAIILQTGEGRDPLYPVLITAEGTTFYKSRLFRSKLDYYVRIFLNDELGLFCEFVRVDDVTLIGTAIAGLA